MVALAVSVVVTVGGTALCFAIGARRRPGTPLTWGEAMVGATFVFGLMLVAYGIVPDRWLRYADDELLWRSDRTLYRLAFFGRGEIEITYQALRDIIVSGIYVVMLVAHVALFAIWQKRGKKPAAVEPVSAYGRPLVRKS